MAQPSLDHLEGDAELPQRPRQHDDEVEVEAEPLRDLLAELTRAGL